jgi:hypothetical protein
MRYCPSGERPQIEIHLTPLAGSEEKDRFFALKE